MMAGLDDILSALPIDQIAAQLGVDPAEARRAVGEGGATILTGLQRNAATPEGAAALESALGRHVVATTDAPRDLDSIDAADGQRILGHIFHGQEQQVAQGLTDAPSTAGVDFGRLLPLLAPLVMGLLANQRHDGQGPSQGGGGLEGLLGGLLGGAASAGSGSGAIDIGGLLGGLLGGKS
ncbi:MAG: DUF937 domain-containing protein [Dehalococcoidia bacterium]